MDEIEKHFFETYNIEHNEQYPKIDANKILAIEDSLSTFTIERDIAPADIITYKYNIDGYTTKPCINRKEALLKLLCNFPIKYKERIKALF